MLLGHLLDKGGEVGVGVRAEDKDLKFGIVRNETVISWKGDNQLLLPDKLQTSSSVRISQEIYVLNVE